MKCIHREVTLGGDVHPILSVFMHTVALWSFPAGKSSFDMMSEQNYK